MKQIDFIPQGVCSYGIHLVFDEHDRVAEVQFAGGCHGNLQGIAALVKGMPAEEVVKRLQGIRCGSKATSCPDQLCCAIKELMAR